MKSAINQLNIKNSLSDLERSNLNDNIKQLLNMAREIKAAKKIIKERSKKNAPEAFHEHFCEQEYGREIERKKEIIKVLWPIYKNDLNNLSKN